MNENTTTNWSKWSLVEVKGTLEVLPSADPRVERGLPKEIECQFRLWEKQVPEIRGKRRVYPCQDRQEVAFEGAGSTHHQLQVHSAVLVAKACGAVWPDVYAIG